ncbi:MAG: F0F1 ATP synthase subunit B, partial [Actinobacteria bacterium]|nr:F0F1 ATP synthase subunit B [Actinomycetota bacterium]
MSTQIVLLASEGAGLPIIPTLTEVIVGLIAFSLLFIVMKSKVVPRFEKAFADRTDAIQGGMERAEQAQAEAAAA